MARVYVRTHVGLMDDEDYASLSVVAKAAWHTMNMLQGKQTEERFKNRQQITMLLRREGFDDPGAVIQELENNRWITDDPEGGVSLKGFTKWQAAKRNQYMQEYRALRNSNERAPNGTGQPDSVEGTRNSNEHARAESLHVPSLHVPSRPVPSRDRVNDDDSPFYGPHPGPVGGLSCRHQGPHFHPRGEFPNVG